MGITVDHARARGYRGSIRVTRVAPVPEEKNYLELHLEIVPPPPWPTGGPPNQIVYLVTNSEASNLAKRISEIIDR